MGCSCCFKVGVNTHFAHLQCQCVNIFTETGAASAFIPYTFTQALEKMEQDWSTVVVDVLPYKNTGTYILANPTEASQLLDDHIVMTQSMSFSPFKKTFEAQISTWESKLRLTRVHTRSSGSLGTCCVVSHVVLLPSFGAYRMCWKSG